MKLELTIKVDWLSGWTTYDAIREGLQNGKDAETEFHAPMSVRYRPDTQTLVIENEGCTLPHEALLLGHTTKTDRPDMIGKFGEGLKIGVLVLVRSGHSVKIRSGSEVWTPSIQRSEKFQADVLTFEIEKGRADRDRVQLEIGGIDTESWDKMRECFLFLLKPAELDKCRIETAYGDLLLGEKYAGKMFVKGIFVQSDPELRYGYNFKDAEVDRDRRMVETWDRNYKCRAIWTEALNKRPDLLEPFVQMLDQQTTDLSGIEDWNARNLSQEVREAVVKNFQERHGEDALPVSSLSESRDIEHLGKKGIVAPKPLKAVLETVLGSAATVKFALTREVVQVYSWGDLDLDERSNLEQAITVIADVTPVTLDDIEIADFRDPKTRCLWKDGKVVLGRMMLAERATTLRGIVHELGHKLSQETDGAKDHTDCVETLWAQIVDRLLGCRGMVN